MPLTVSCPHCKNYMKYQGREGSKSKIKKCVFCGKSFTVNEDTICHQNLDKIARKRHLWHKKYK